MAPTLSSSISGSSNVLRSSQPSQLKTIEVTGILSSVGFQMARCCAEDLHKKEPKVFAEPKVNAMFEFEWQCWITAKKEGLRGEMWSFKDLTVVFVDGQLLGDHGFFLKWATDEHNYEDFRNVNLYETLRKEYCVQAINDKKESEFVFMEFEDNGEPCGRLVIELFKNRCPRTVENFLKLCTGELGRSEQTGTNLNYTNSTLHRIVERGWIQGGDLVSGKGSASESIWGGQFDDETFQIAHDKPGVVGMANTGRHTNGSQFYVTMEPAPWMDRKYVAFGQVVEGSTCLKKLNSVETQNERPLKDVKISNCGKFNYFLFIKEGQK